MNSTRKELKSNKKNLGNENFWREEAESEDFKKIEQGSDQDTPGVHFRISGNRSRKGKVLCTLISRMRHDVSSQQQGRLPSNGGNQRLQTSRARVISNNAENQTTWRDYRSSITLDFSRTMLEAR